MSIKLLALDLDGTLLDSRGQCSARNRAAIDAARLRGVRVALVTGRRFRDARPLALELGLDVPVISHNGALTKHARTLETVAVNLLPLEAAHAVIRLGREAGADALVSDDARGAGVLVYDRISPGNEALAKYVAWSRRIVGEQAASAVLQVESLEAYLDHPPIHIAFSGTYQEIKNLSAQLERELAGQVKLLATLYPHQNFGLLDVLHPRASKGAGLAAVAEELNLTRDEVMAIGDNFNDLEMLRYAGIGVLMSNAEAALRDAENFHPTASNDEDGVAVAIEKFILVNREW
jgi:Cof subfamily protein (haloacid dehalogenase superfamily)